MDTGQHDGIEALETTWLTSAQAAKYERISKMEVSRRANDPSHPHHLVSIDRVPGKPKLGKLINRLSLTAEGQERLRQDELQSALMADTRAVSAAPCENSGQGRLWPANEVDRQLLALQAQCGEEYAAHLGGRVRSVLHSLNHEFMALGFRSETAYFRHLAKQEGISLNTFKRLRGKYLKRELVSDLADKRPGPAKGYGAILDAAIRAHIRDCWEEKLCTRAGTTRNVIDWIKWKQNRCGARYTYEILAHDKPTRWMAVERYIDSIGGESNPRRRRSQGLIDQVGLIDRTFEDEFSGDTWCIDEWELHGAFYNPRKRREIYWGDSGRKPYLVSVIDERSTYLLGATLTLDLTADTVLTLLEALVRTYGPPLRLVSDKGGHFRKGVGGRIMVRQRGELVERCMGAMANFGVVHEQPRKKNPRGNRIERTLHGAYADFARRDFGPSWKGANLEERKLTEIDERVARHLKEHCDLGISGPLILSYDDAERITSAWRDEINMLSGKASGLLGLTRQAAWLQFQRPDVELAARRPSEDQIRMAFAEYYKDEPIEKSGVVTLPDGERYENALLCLPEFVGQRRQVVRYRDDHSFAIVLAAHKGEENIIARRRVRVGVNDKQELSRQSEYRAHREKILKSIVPDAPPLPAPAIQSPVETEPPLGHPEISSMEYFAGKKHIIRPAEFCAPEVETIAQPNGSGLVPSLYDYSEQGKVEKL